MNPHPHELAPLLLALGRAGIELAPHPTDAGRLRHRPADLPPDLSARLRLHRAAVLGLLVTGYAPDAHGDTDAEYIVGERLGVADELGMPTHPGSAAWLVAVGESIGPAHAPPIPRRPQASPIAGGDRGGGVGRSRAGVHPSTRRAVSRRANDGTEMPPVY